MSQSVGNPRGGKGCTRDISSLSSFIRCPSGTQVLTSTPKPPRSSEPLVVLYNLQFDLLFLVREPVAIQLKSQPLSSLLLNLVFFVQVVALRSGRVSTPRLTKASTRRYHPAKYKLCKVTYCLYCVKPFCWDLQQFAIRFGSFAKIRVVLKQQH